MTNITPLSDLTRGLTRHLQVATDVARLACEVFGAEPAGSGVIHPAAGWRDGDRLHSLVIGPETPKSSLDAFSLYLARARADAVVTTGKILRSEPKLTHELLGPDGMPEALALWRKNILGKEDPPISLVITSGKDLDLDHPLFRERAKSVVFTSQAGQRRLASAAEGKVNVELVTSLDSGIRSAIRWLQRRGARTISIEAGPSTSQELYQAPLWVDELLLSVYGAPTLPEPLRGGQLPPLQQLAAQFPGLAAYSPGKGDWSFYRYFR